jgi:ABC-2 type transport system ATP-binding protein
MSKHSQTYDHTVEEQILMTESVAYAAPAPTRANAGDVVLRATNLTKQYGKRRAVDNLTMDVHRGDIFGFLGPNGAGKTTTIRMALGLIAPTAGRVEVLGRDISADSTSILPHIGALVETPALYPYMSGRNNLRAVSYALGGVSEPRIDAVLDLVGMRARQGDRVRTYSLGMKQRLGVAMAMLNDPEVLVLDEPANGLDPAGIVEMRDLMRLLSSQGKTVFISSHVLGEVQQICTRVAIINQGKLVTESTVKDLTRGQGQFIVYVEHAPEALAAIQAQPWGKTARLDPNGVLIAPAPEDRGRNLNAFLVQAGFIPDAIMYQSESLEQVFLRLTSAATGGVQ